MNQPSLNPVAHPAHPIADLGAPARTVGELRAMSFRGLARMYLPEERAFVFRLRCTDQGIVSEGRSRRYAAIALIGLATETAEDCAVALRGHTPHDPLNKLAEEVDGVTNLGDVALATWAAQALKSPHQEKFWKRLHTLASADKPQPTVEVAWSLYAACLLRHLDKDGLAPKLAARLMQGFSQKARVFPHVLGKSRAHVACFADMVYPIQSLSLYSQVYGDQAALNAASLGAATICERQGPAGQWWWHYNVRTGGVVEGYPVYAIHQDAMGPIALCALAQHGGPDYSAAIRKGLDWLWHAPEINGSLIDPRADIIWRKVARREPKKLTRYLKASASYLHPSLGVPGIDWVLPPRIIDAECRPYHLGWLLHAWPAARAAKWDRMHGAGK